VEVEEFMQTAVASHQTKSSHLPDSRSPPFFDTNALRAEGSRPYRKASLDSLSVPPYRGFLAFILIAGANQFPAI
jgi:hypothetical protein